MTQDEIIRMALEIGIETDWSFDFKIRLERFAALVAAHEREKQAEQEPVARHICNLWVDPVTKQYVVDHCDHPTEELIPAYSTNQYLSKEPDYWLGYGLQAYTKKPFEGATPLYAAPVRTKDLTDDEIQKWIDVLVYDPPEWALKRFARAVIAADREKNK